jgi:histone H3/H4
MTRVKTAPTKRPNLAIKKLLKKKKTSSASEPEKKDRKKRRYRSGTRALREVRKAQKGDNKGFDVAPLKKLIRQIAKESSPSGKTDVRFGKQAILALKQAGEDYVTYFMKMAQVCTIQGQRQTVKQKDCKLAAAFMHGMHYLQQPNGTERMFRGILGDPVNVSGFYAPAATTKNSESEESAELDKEGVSAVDSDIEEGEVV